MAEAGETAISAPPLASLPPFKTLSTETLAWLRDELGWVTVPGGGLLFSAGGAADTLFIVVSGLLGVVIATPDRGQELVAEIHPGETAGEMSMLMGEGHSAGVVALRHTELYAVPKTVFDRLVEAEPHFIVWMARLLVHRLHRTTFRTPKAESHDAIALLAADATVPVEALAAGLVKALVVTGTTAYHIGPESSDQPPDFFARIEAAHEVVVYTAPRGGDFWSVFCLRQADRIILTAWPDSLLGDPLPSPPVAKAGKEPPLELLLLEPSGPGRAGTSPERPERFATIHHLRLDAERDIMRLARHLAGNSVGLVLGGGAARGFAHIGAVRALREAGVPFDRIGGTSMGGIIAAGIAAGWDDRELRDRIHAAFVANNPLDDYTIPWIALFRGRSVERLLAQHFGDLTIESLWLPYFCVSTNLTSGGIEVHRHGMVRRALRASVAIPGVLPPVIERNQVLVDGGVIDNFPIDIMAGSGRGAIIGIDVAGDQALMPGTEVPPRPLGMLNWFLPQTPMPGIVSVLSRVGIVSSQLQRALARSEADLLIEPDLTEVPLLDWRSFDRAVDAGYAATAEAIGRLKGGVESLIRKDSE